MTTRDILDRYVAQVLPRKAPATTSAQARQCEWWTARIGDVPLDELTRSAIIEARDDLAQATGPATANRYLAVLRHALGVACRDWELIPRNPAAGIRALREPRGRVRFLDDGEREHLLAECRGELRVLVILALSTGGRKSELTGLRWPDVDFDRPAVTFRDTKNGETRAVPLCGAALVELVEHGRLRRIDDDRVFRGVDVDRAFRAAVARAGIADFRFHDLRHSAASYLAMSGASLLEIAAVLGHKTLAMVKRYAHLSDGHLSDVVARMNERIG